MTVSITQAEAISLADAAVDRVDLDSPGTPGFVRVYNNTPPDDANAALNQYATNDLICTITLGTTAFGNAAWDGGLSKAKASVVGTPSNTCTTTTVANGPITFFRVFRGNGTVLWQGSCGLSGQDMNLSTLTVTDVNQSITINTFDWTQAAT